MPTFEYACRDGAGAVVRGRVEAEDDARARAQLRQQGLFITSLRTERAPRRRGGGAGNRAEVVMLTHHLAMLVGAALPLVQALEALAEQTEEKWMREVVQEVARDIEQGKSLSAALGRRPDLFSPLYIGIVRYGEISGRLDEALDRLAAYLERDLEFRRKVRDALLYPGLVLALAAVVLAFFLIYIIPAFDRVYRLHGADLPPLTRGLLAASALFRGNLPLVAVAVFVLILPPTRRLVWSALAGPLYKLVLRLPYAGPLAQAIFLSRFAHTMGAMLQSGVPVLSALEVAGEAVAVPEFGPIILTLRTQVSEGRSLSVVMRQTRRFPPMFMRMVALGEESGRLDTMLERAGAMLDREFDLRMRRLLTFLEPALTLLLGGVIGVVLMALYLPIFGLSKAIMR
jgi:type II secretory pathway component PulF